MKIAVLSSHTSSLFWFRMNMMQDFIKHGHEVIALGSEPVQDWGEKFKQHGIVYKQLYVQRNGVNPLKDIKTFFYLLEFFKREAPDKVFAYQAKTVIYGCVAARIRGISENYPLIAGLGSVYRGEGLKNHILKFILRMEYLVALKCSKKVFFQNEDDKNEFIFNRLIREDKSVVINGSGVDLDRFRPRPLPKEMAFLFVGRLIKDKGIKEYLYACDEIKRRHPNARCLLVGPFDSNPSALTPGELEPYIRSGTIEYFGAQDDVRPFIQQCSAFVLPSYHEGTPKTVLEAMAMGRAIITCDTPGCRETVMDGVNGYLVSPRSVKELVERMELFLCNSEKAEIMGRVSERIAREKYDVRKVNQNIMRTMHLAH